MALKILLADDSMTAQNMGKKILLDAGYEVVAVSNGAAAIKRIASDRPDIIILDVYMPGYTGLEVCERVKGAPETARTPVLLTVGKMEPFKPEEANRVRADGVMIKPFEATDLIAAIQGIATKMASGTPQPSRDERAQAEPETVPVDPTEAQPEPAFEDTVRLTPEQVRAFQDQTYKDWVATSEVEGGQPAAVAPEMLVTPPLVVAESEPVSAEPLVVPSILEPTVSSVIEEAQPAMPMMPGLDATDAPIARAMAGRMGQDFFTVEPAAPSAVDEDAASAAPAFFASSVEHLVETPEPVFSIQMPEPVELTPEGPVIAQAASLELETSAPLTPGPSFVPAVEELEPTIAAPEESIVSEVAPELEINSPIHLQEQVEVTPEADLITNEEDMSQFVTKFGQDAGEQIAVGIASELPPEQMAALITPDLEETQELPPFEIAEVSSSNIVELETPSPVLPEAVTVTEVEAAVATPTNVLEEVGSIDAEAALSSTGPIVAYVPGLDDTQPIPAFVVPNAEVQAVPESVVEAEPEPLVATLESEPVVVAEPEPVVADSEPVAAVAENTATEPEPVSTMHVVEAAAAVAVGGAALAGGAHFFSPAPAHEESSIGAFAPAVDEPLASSEPVDHAAVAEELSAVSEKEPEEHVAAGAEAAITSAVEPAVTAAVIESAGPDAHLIADAKLSEAVSHALEKLRPQLIAEIMKELSK